LPVNVALAALVTVRSNAPPSVDWKAIAPAFEPVVTVTSVVSVTAPANVTSSSVVVTLPPRLTGPAPS